jgi:hypothetical protein
MSNESVMAATWYTFCSWLLPKVESEMLCLRRDRLPHVAGPVAGSCQRWNIVQRMLRDIESGRHLLSVLQLSASQHGDQNDENAQRFNQDPQKWQVLHLEAAAQGGD